LLRDIERALDLVPNVAAARHAIEPGPSRPGRAPTGSSPPAMPTSTPPGCGRSARRDASASARSRRRSV
jgi:hypothetical protein